MANLTPTPGWDDVFQLERNTAALGGEGGPMNLQAQALLNRTEWLRNQIINVKDRRFAGGAKCDGTTDDREAIQAAIDYAAENGGGIVWLPGGVGYSISDALTVSSSNTLLVLEADIELTKTTATSESPCSAIRIIGTSSSFIENVGIVAPRRVTIDCNGRNVTGYTHVGGASSVDADHHGVLVRFAKNIRLKNLYGYNGLIGCITVSYCLGGTIEDCDVSHSVYDNGIYIFGNGEQIVAFSETDPSTWSNIRAVRCRAWNCANHGLGIYGAVGVTYESPKIWNCGNNTGTADAGPAGGLGVEFDGTNYDRNYRFTATNVEVTGSYGFGIRTNCRGTVIRGGFVRGTKIPTNYSDSSPAIWGSAIFVQGGAKDCDITCDVKDSERVGLRVQSAGSHYPGVKYRGTIEGCAERAVYAIGFDFFESDPTCIFKNNGSSGNTTPGSYYTVDLNNAPANTNAGTAIVAGRFDNNKGGCIQSLSVGYVDLTRGVSGIDNQAAYSSGFHAIYIPSCVELLAASILLSSNNGKQTRVLKCDAATKAVIDRTSILGDQSNANTPKADVTATTIVGELIGTATYDPPSVAANSFGATTTVTVTGAVVGDRVSVTFAGAVSLFWQGIVTAANTVTVFPYNPTGSSIDAGSNVLRVVVTKVFG